MREAGAWRAPPRGGGSFAERLKRIMLWGVGVGLEREGWVEEKRKPIERGALRLNRFCRKNEGVHCPARSRRRTRRERGETQRRAMYRKSVDKGLAW